MKYLARRYISVTLSVLILRELVSAFTIKGNLPDLLLATLILTVIFSIVRKIANLVFFPLNLLTLNIFSWIINFILIYIWIIASGTISIKPWNFPGLSFSSFMISSVSLGYWSSVLLISFLIILLIRFFDWLLV